VIARLAGREVRAVLFDYGLTLVTFERPAAALHRAYTDIAALLVGRGVESIEAELLLDRVHDVVEEAVRSNERSGSLAEVDIAGTHRDAYAALGLRLDDETLDEVQRIEQDAWVEGMRVAPGVVPTLESLRRGGLRLGLCSNAAWRPASLHRQLERLGLDHLLDAAVFSSAVGWRKPSRRIFAAALSALGTAAESTVMVGDRLREDVLGAQAAGMLGVLLLEHGGDAGPGDPHSADATLTRLADLPALLGLG
jgi:HAD superfamily hydrolase (TIGR01549 family)